MLKVKLPSGKYRDASRCEVMEIASEYATQGFNERMAAQIVSSPAAAEDFLREVFQGLEREKFGVLFLDSRHRVIRFEIMFSGTIDGASVSPREVVKRALELNAADVILAHNHPSGVAEPSDDDERLTSRLKIALELIAVRLVDHLIVGSGGHVVSFAARGVI